MKDITALTLRDDEFTKIQTIVYNAAGINLVSSKRALVVSRLAKRLRQLKLSTFHDYILRLEQDTDEVLFMINRITTNHTRFYREDNQFRVLTAQVLPRVLADKKSRKENFLRIWSAGCSTGEEVYTILFEVATYLKGKVNGTFDIKILGSDIDTVVLKKAASGIYSQQEIQGVEQTTVERFFDRLAHAHFRIKDRWRRLVFFRRINLVTDPFSFKRKVDIIFCRNVVIYFDKPTQDSLYKKFHTVMNEPGYFFAGHSENLFKYNRQFKFIEKSVYKKVV